MTDEWYKKKRLEEMQKQTECLVNIAKLLADIRDVGRTDNILRIAMMDSEKGKPSDRMMRHVDKELRKLSDAMEERWSE